MVRGGQRCCKREVLKLQQYLDKSFIKVFALKVWVVFVHFLKILDQTSFFFHLYFCTAAFGWGFLLSSLTLSSSPGFVFIHPLPFSINWAGSVFGLAWLGSVNPSMAIQYCGVIFCHWCGFKLTLCTKWALCDPFFLTQRFSWSQ